MTMWLGWELRQIVKHEKVVVEKSLFSRFVINLDLFIYSLIHRPEHLGLVLNCCFELIKVWVNYWAVFLNFLKQVSGGFFLVKSHVTRFICYNYSRDMSCIIKNDECRKLNYVKMRNNIKSRPFFIVV